MGDRLYRDFRPGALKDFDGLQRDNFAYFDRRRVSDLTEWAEGAITARDSFLDDVARGQLRDVSWIDPNFVDVSVLEAISNDDHPPSSVLNGQSLVLEIYEALYKSTAWEDTMLVIVYDEHGGFYDHVHPPPALDDPEFRTLGVRVPAIVVGPRVRQQVCHTLFDHPTLIKTILNRFAGGDGSGEEGELARLLRSRLAREELGERAPRPEDEGFHGRVREVELGCDLLVREAAPFTEEDRAALELRHPRKRIFEADELLCLSDVRRRHVSENDRVAQHLPRAFAPARPVARTTGVLRDREEPAGLRPRHDAAAEAAVRPHEGRLGDVLGLLPAAQLVQAEAVDAIVVTLVEKGRAVGRGLGVR